MRSSIMNTMAKRAGRPISVRMKAHLRGKLKNRQSNPLGINNAHKHNGDDFGVGVTILALESKTSQEESKNG